MIHILLREAGGLGDILQVGSVARALKERDPGSEVHLFTLADPGILNLAQLIPYVDEVHVLRFLTSERRPRGDTHYQAYPYLMPVLEFLKEHAGAKLHDLWCPAWTWEKKKAQMGEPPGYSRAQLFGMAAGIEPTDIRSPELDVTTVPLGLRTVVRTTLGGEDWVLVNLLARDPVKSIHGERARRIISETALRCRRVVVFSYPDTDEDAYFLSDKVYWFPKDLGYNPDRWDALNMAVELALGTSAMLAVDSFMFHLGATLGKPIVLLTGPTAPSTLAAHYRKVIWPASDPTLTCAGCHYQKCNGCIPACRDDGCRVLSSFQPAILAEAVKACLYS